VKTLGGLDLIAGGLPTQYGDRMTGLLDMRTKQPIGNGRRNSLGFSVSNFTGRSQGTFNDGRGGWLVSGRRGFLDLLLAMAQDGDDNEDLSPRYFDAMGKVELLVGTGHRLSAHVLYAGDDLNLTAFDSPTERGELHTDWRNANAWLNWAWQLAPSVDASTMFSVASLTRTRTGFLTGDSSSEQADEQDVSDEGEFDFLTVRQDWRWAAADRIVLKLGGQLRLAQSRYTYRSDTGRQFARPDSTIGLEFDSVRVSIRPESTEMGVYLATRLQPHDRLVLELGGRYDYRSHTSDSDISPRVQAALELTTNTTLRASWGTYYQSHGLWASSMSSREVWRCGPRSTVAPSPINDRAISMSFGRSSRSPRPATTGSVSFPSGDGPRAWNSSSRGPSAAAQIGRPAMCWRGQKTSWRVDGFRGRSINATP